MMTLDQVVAYYLLLVQPWWEFVALEASGTIWRLRLVGAETMVTVVRACWTACSILVRCKCVS